LTLNDDIAEGGGGEGGFVGDVSGEGDDVERDGVDEGTAWALEDEATGFGADSCNAFKDEGTLEFTVYGAKLLTWAEEDCPGGGHRGVEVVRDGTTMLYCRLSI
jgi:hypothetical protein